MIEQIFYATDENGNPLTPLPLMHKQPEVKHEITHSNDLTYWGNYNDPIVTFDQVGIEGLINTATKIFADDASVLQNVRTTVSMPVDTTVVTVIFHLKKEDTATVNHRLGLYFQGGTAEKYSSISINLTTGQTIIEYDETGSVVISIELIGNFWKICLTFTNDPTNENNIARILIGPANYDLDTADTNTTLTGYVICGNTELYFGINNIQAKNLGTIITEDDPVLADESRYVIGIDNFSDDSMLEYAELELDGDCWVFSDYLTYVNEQLILTDSAGNTISKYLHLNKRKLVAIAINSVDAKMTLYVDGNWSEEETYSGSLLDVDFILFDKSIYPQGIFKHKVHTGEALSYLKQILPTDDYVFTLTIDTDSVSLQGFVKNDFGNISPNITNNGYEFDQLTVDANKQILKFDLGKMDDTIKVKYPGFETFELIWDVNNSEYSASSTQELIDYFDDNLTNDVPIILIY